MKPIYDECDALLTEAIFDHRWVLLCGYHSLGELVLQHNLDIMEVSRATRQRPKTIWYAKELARLYPDINSVPDGKVASWYKITKTLPKYEKDSTEEKK